VCRADKHYFYETVPQYAVIDKSLVKYYICECGLTVLYDGRKMTLKEFLDETEKSQAQHVAKDFHRLDTHRGRRVSGAHKPD
jgi:hypothetical protein